MTRPHNDRSSDRQQIILDATLELVATDGLLNTSISKISQRAQSSPGILYHYFESKDAIMQTLYESGYREMMAYIMDDDLLKLPILERYKGLWLRKYHFHRSNPEKTVFMEQFKNSSYYTAEQDHLTNEMLSRLLLMGQEDIKRGLVINLPLDVIYTMTFTVALNLAKSHIAADTRIDAEVLDMIAERVSRSVLA
jgi:AcrR family transcriptional regulator